MSLTFIRNLFKKNEEGPLSSGSLRNILSEVLTHQLMRLGLNKYDGEYLWYSDFNQEGIRKVFKYTRMKGNTGLFSWGVCFKHVPTVTNSKRLQYHRTEKSIALHLWEWPSGYSVSLEKDVPPADLVSHSNDRQCRQTLYEIIGKYRGEIEQWYRRCDTLEGCLEITNHQIERGGVYQMRWPTGNYVKIFLLALQGNKEKAKELLGKSSRSAVRGSSDWRSLAVIVEKEIDNL